MAVINRVRTWLEEHDPIGDVTKPIFQKVEDKLEDVKESEIGSKFGISVKGKDFHILDPYIWTADVMSELDHPELLLPTPAGGASLAGRGILAAARAAPKAVRLAKRVGSPVVRKLGKTKTGKAVGKFATKAKKGTSDVFKSAMTSKRKKALEDAATTVGVKAASIGKKARDVKRAVQRNRPSAIISRHKTLGKIPIIGKPPPMPPLIPAKTAVGRAETDYLASKMTQDQGFAWDALMGDVVEPRIQSREKERKPMMQQRSMSSDIESIQAPAGTDESIFRKALAQAVAEVRPEGKSAPLGSDVPGLADEELSAIELDRIKKLCTKFCSKMEHKAERKGNKR